MSCPQQLTLLLTVHVQTVGVSAVTGDGLPAFVTAIDAATVEYERLLTHVKYSAVSVVL